MDDSGKQATQDDANGDESNADGSPEKGWIRRTVQQLFSPSRQRLESELKAFQIQVETFEDRLETAGEDPFRTETARRLLEKAEEALAQNNVVAYREFLYAAKRWHLIATHQLNEVYANDSSGPGGDGGESVSGDPSNGKPASGADKMGEIGIRPLTIKAWRLQSEAAETLSGWRKRAVENLLSVSNPASTAEGSESVTIDELVTASRILHEYYIEREFRRRVLGYQFVYFITATVITVGFILTYAIATGEPIVGGAANMTGEAVDMTDEAANMNGKTVDMTAPQFLIPVVLFGMLGSAVSGILSLARAFKDRRLPHQIDDVWLAIARISMGAAAALAVFVFLQSDLLQIGPSSDPGVMLAMAFTAGFSERLLLRAVHAVTGDDLDDVEPVWTPSNRTDRGPEGVEEREHETEE